MTTVSPEPLKDPDGKPLDPASQAVVDRVRRMSAVSGFATMLGIAVVIAVIGFKLYRSADSAPPQQPVDVLTMLPKGSRIIAAQTAGDRLVVTVDVGGAIEVRTFDTRTLQQTGRLRFVEER
ncbi:MAG: hypothetical protein ACOY5F_20410 [Pseudomonadota bacterium]|jgi:hypothetical protein